MRFYNRKNELMVLEKLLEIPDKSVIAIIIGMRRVGKTELIKQFFMDKEGIYLYVDNEKTQNELLLEFNKTLVSELSLPSYVKAESFEDIIKIMFGESKNKKIIIAIDEFQRFMNQYPSFITQLQKYFDLNVNTSNLFLIISGSAIGMMKKIFEDKKAPLFGRSHNTIYLKPFSFKIISKILNDFGIADFEDIVKFYSIYGGMPRYYILICDFKIKEPMESINDLLLNDLAPLRKEVRTVITEEFGKEVQAYYGILTAIALGKTKSNEIANHIGIKETSLSPYLNDLIDVLEVIKREIPVTESLKSKRSRYYLKDNFFRFWFRFIYRNRSYYEVGNYDPILNEIQQNFNSYVGLSFEEICKEFLTGINKNKKLPFYFDEIGKWWGSYRDEKTGKRKSDEIDIVALNKQNKQKKEILFVEVKWKTLNINDTKKILDELKEKSRYVNWYNNDRYEYFGVIAKKIEGKEELREEDVVLFDLSDILSLI